ncbi:MAG: glycosyltransferase family 4 protein, partial [Actinomycetota bacterium]|nr:glycosyltransferase family 4 protein [Actinomycetota bacterium]
MTRPLRALFVSEGALGIGTVGHARNEPALRAGLNGRDDIEARFVTLAPQDPVSKSLARGVPGLGRADLDLQPVRWHLVQAARARRLLERELRRAPADVVHVVSHSIALGMVATMRELPVLLSSDISIWRHRQMELWAPLHRHSRAMLAPSLALERRSLRSAALVLPWTDWARAGFAAEAPDVRYVVHNPGLDLETFRPAPREPRERPRVLFIGGRFVQKGGQDLLDAVALVGRERLDLDVVTFEDIPQRPGMRVHRNVPRERLLELLQQADIACLPSRADAFSWAALEAMACGVPVIAARTGGVSDLIGGGVAGILVAPRDPRALAGALTRLLEDPR